MRCPYCHGIEDRVVDSRTSQEGRAVRRRRECLGCSKRFTTYEYVEERQLLVTKRDGSSEPFDRQKVLKSIQLPCAKRPITGSDIELMVNAIEDELAKLNSRRGPQRQDRRTGHGAAADAGLRGVRPLRVGIPELSGSG
jgi:transcriptional repressor NrdR